MAQPAQVSDGGWVASRLVGGQERTLTTGQRQLRDKMVNLITTGSIKRPQAVYSDQQHNRIMEEEWKNKKEQRHRKKQKAKRKNREGKQKKERQREKTKV